MIKNRGLAFHCHHSVLLEYVWDYKHRVKCIKNNKPAQEQKLRRKLFQLIPPKLYPGKNSAELIAYHKAEKAYEKAGTTYDKTRKAYEKADTTYEKTRKAYNKAKEACNKAREANNKAREAYNKAREACREAKEAHNETLIAYITKYSEEIKALHAKMCPQCPWNGETIFSEV